MNILELSIPTYNENDDLTKIAESSIIEWTLQKKDVLALEKVFKAKCKGVKKKRTLIKTKRNSSDVLMDNIKHENIKVTKVEIKQECA